MTKDQEAILEAQRLALHEAYELHRQGDYEGAKRITRSLSRWLKSVRRSR